MKERLQQFLFPQEKSQSGRLRRISSHGVKKREGNYNEQYPKYQQNDDNLEVDTNSDTRSLYSDQIYVVMPFKRLPRYSRSFDERLFKIDLARTDLPWYIPSTLILDDGVRRINLQTITTPSGKCKKSSNIIQYDEDFSKNLLNYENSLSYQNRIKSEAEPIQLLSKENNEVPLLLPKSSQKSPQSVSNYVEKSLPLRLNIDITNLIPPESVPMVQVSNMTRIEPSGNVHCSILFDLDKNKYLSDVIHSTQTPNIHYLSNDLTKIFQASGINNLNKLISILNNSLVSSVTNAVKNLPNDRTLQYSDVSSNKEDEFSKNKLINLQLNDSSNLINILNSKEFKSSTLKSINKQSPLSMDYHHVNKLNAEIKDLTRQNNDSNATNTTLALNSLLELIKLLQAGNNNNNNQDN
ncbi:hypothetical protein O3M35_008479 [Rhynocoris fuscipes]|uniref:Uncharacterized protein n=1 Tax=Rhynocoris fuscipes TaxID=488301 RepID=A0AAW1D772_9HEMI